MSVVVRWRAKLATRKALLASARGRAAYWRARKRAAKPGSKAYSRAGHYLALREALVKQRKEQVAYAQRVLARRQEPVSRVSSKGLAMVASHEGFRSAPYRDPVGVWTIGYGETRGVGPNTKPVTRAQALRTLRTRIDRDYLAPALRFCRAHGFEPRQCEADALASFAYNLGPGVFTASSSIGRAIISKDRRRIADAFLLYDKAGGRTLPGLATRRKAERALFLS